MNKDFQKALLFCVINLAFELDCADETQVNDDFAVSLMEQIAAELQSLDAEERRKFDGAIQELVVVEANEERKDFFRDFLDNLGLTSNS